MTHRYSVFPFLLKPVISRLIEGEAYSQHPEQDHVWLTSSTEVFDNLKNYVQSPIFKGLGLESVAD